jgi:hypothetical protein
MWERNTEKGKEQKRLCFALDELKRKSGGGGEQIIIRFM